MSLFLLYFSSDSAAHTLIVSGLDRTELHAIALICCLVALAAAADWM